MTAPTSESEIHRRVLYLAVFVSGMTTLAVELTASRLLGSVFGTSNLVWANVIGLMLLYLTAGYFIGGRWADRSPSYETMYTILVWAAFLSALIPLGARPVLRVAAEAVVGAEAALALGSFLGVLVLFSVPVTLLGCVSPFAIRLALHRPEEAGRVSGQIYAMSTLGSLLGTFAPTLFLIPELGTIRTFIVVSGVLYMVALLGLWLQRPSLAVRWLWMPLLIISLAHWALSGPLRPPQSDEDLLFETESAYNYIQVIEDSEGFRKLFLNEGQGVHSQYHPEYVAFGGTWELFLAAPYFNSAPFTPDEVQRLLVVGLAAGTIPRQYLHVYGDMPIDGIEIDPGVVEAGARFFDMNAQAMPSLNVIVQDGRYALNLLEDNQYTVIAVDAYRPPYIPWHLTTVEFFQELEALLAPDGVVAINVGRTSTDRRLVDAMANTLSYVFPSVHAIDVPRAFNTILVATKQPTDFGNLSANLRFLPESAPLELRNALTTAYNEYVTVGYSDVVFTDDHAPVERLIDSLVINFLLYGNLEEIR